MIDQKCGICKKWAEVAVSVDGTDVAIGECRQDAPSSVTVARRSMMGFTSGANCPCFDRKVRGYNKKAVAVDPEPTHVSEK